MSNNINLIPNNNEINLVNQDRAIIVSDQDNFTQIEVTQPITSVVQILTGPMGPEGPAGKGTFPFSGSADISGSFNLQGNATITGSLFLFSGSYSGSGANLFNIPKIRCASLVLEEIATKIPLWPGRSSFSLTFLKLPPQINFFEIAGLLCLSQS